MTRRARAKGLGHALLAVVFAAVAITLATLPHRAGAEPRGYRLDPDHTVMHFEVLHFGTSTIRGRFGPIPGYVTLDPVAGTGEMGIEIDTRTISTGAAVFDARLRQPDLLATDEHPRAWFVSREFRFDDQGRLLSLRGEFTMRGVSQGLTLEARRFRCAPDQVPAASAAAATSKPN